MCPEAASVEQLRDEQVQAVPYSLMLHSAKSRTSTRGCGIACALGWKP